MTIPPGATPVSLEDPTPEEMRGYVETALEVTPKLRALLAGLAPPVQGAILADLLATFVCGFYPDSVRDDVLTGHILGVIGMIEGQKAASDAALARARDALGKKSRRVDRPKSWEETPPRGPTRGAKRH